MVHQNNRISNHTTANYYMPAVFMFYRCTAEVAACIVEV